MCAHLEEIDGKIEGAAQNWRLARLSATDRNLLRIAAYEMFFCDDVPAQVAINEALEVAKKYGDNDSPKFINGILDALLKDKPEE